MNETTNKIRCGYFAKSSTNTCQNIGSKPPACNDPRLEQLVNQMPTSPFTNTVCSQGDYGIVTMNGKFTNDEKSHSFITLKLGVIDSKGNVVATGTGIISNIQAYETKVFDASTVYSGSFAH